MTTNVIIFFILEHINADFGIPFALILEYGIPFKNNDMKKSFKTFHIQHHFSTPYYPQSNGQAEITNKTLKHILKRIVNKHHKDWHTELQYVLWAYRTSITLSMGTTPYKIIYDTEAIIPLELEIHTLRISLQGLIDNDTYNEQILH